MVRRPLFTRIFHGSIAITLTMWVAGFGCIFGCETASKMATAAVQVHSRVAMATLNHAATNHSCCKRRKNSSQPTVDATLAPPIMLDNGESSVSGCPLAANASALASTSSHPQPPVVAADHVSPALRVAPSSTVPPPALYQNRGHTYLRCCVFLI